MAGGERIREGRIWGILFVVQKSASLDQQRPQFRELLRIYLIDILTIHTATTLAFSRLCWRFAVLFFVLFWRL